VIADAPDALVLDASVTAAWLLPDERTPAAERAYARLRAGSFVAHAPELWLWECGNILVNGVRRGRVRPNDVIGLWNLLDSVRTRVELTVPEPGQVRAALALAVDHGLSIYDAAYLWLASSLALPLLTHDARLRAAAEAQKVPVLGVEDVA
jgi:predicted nucleic acid-binding protein